MIMSLKKTSHLDLFSLIKNKKPLEQQNIYNMIQTIAANAGIDKRKAHPHALRHFFAKSFTTRRMIWSCSQIF